MPALKKISDGDKEIIVVQKIVQGTPGAQGVPGKTGAPGRDGVDGRPGKDGAPGRDGLPGKDGAPGKDGRDGTNGKDGVSPDPEVIITQVINHKDLDTKITTKISTAVSSVVASEMKKLPAGIIAGGEGRANPRDLPGAKDATVGQAFGVLSSGKFGFFTPAGGSGGVSDGDKGDITVSGSGTTWTVDNTAITYSKLSLAVQASLNLADSSIQSGDNVSVLTNDAGYLTSETSHADVVVDGDFASNGILKRTSAGVYGIVTDNSTNWDTAFGWGNHASAGYITSTGVTYENLSANGDIGTGATQVAQGNHTHTGVYEPADATILKDADIGVTVLAYDADVLYADVGDNFTAGYTSDSYSHGTISSGTVTPAPGTGQENFQHYTNNGAHTLAPPAAPCTVVIEVTNGASAGVITTSGFTMVTGDALTTTNGDDFMLFITKTNTFSLLNVVALQ